MPLDPASEGRRVAAHMRVRVGLMAVRAQIAVLVDDTVAAATIEAEVAAAATQDGDQALELAATTRAAELARVAHALRMLETQFPPP